MRHVQARPGQDVFMDYGCGRGRVLAMASTYPFKKVIGIEYSELLSAAARDNVKRINRRKMKCTDIEVISGDAGAYELPPEVTVAYFFDPFEEDVIRRVIEQIHRSLLNAPRKLTIIYYGPAWAEAFEERDWIVKIHDFNFPRRRCYVYETKI
jgi:predicted RNA methylase